MMIWKIFDSEDNEEFLTKIIIELNKYKRKFYSSLSWDHDIISDKSHIYEKLDSDFDRTNE
jgi:hypothetical protein